jgi:predicted DNA-binding antitoxin AbrB/MazE fold protein
MPVITSKFSTFGIKALAVTIRAIYEQGVFRPTEKVEIPDHCEVEIDVRPVKNPANVPTLDDVYEILGRRHSTGEHDLAARHNEHQP